MKIQNYLRTIVFNGVFSVTKLIDEIQQVSGVTECVWMGGESWTAAQVQSEAILIVDRHRAASGYFAIAKDENEDLQLNLEMIREL